MKDEPEGLIVVAASEPRYPAGFTAIGIIVLAALAYSLRISLDPDAGNHLLTFTFLLANVVGWLLGSVLRTRDPRSVVGLLLVLLGDAIFPINLFAPLMLFAPLLRGNVPLSATAVIVVGIAYHLWNYRHRSSARFALAFYPYFFAFAATTALVLTHFTAGLSMSSVAWLVLLCGAAFNELSYRRRPEPALHFAIAGAVILLASIVVSAVAFRDRGDAALAAMVVGTLLLIASAIRERSEEAIARAHALTAWLGLTFTFTALLYYVHSPLSTYILATGGWILILGIVSTLPASGWREPFQESAWWAEMLLATGLAGTLWQVWMPFIMRTMSGSRSGNATAAALTGAGVALLYVGAWRRRNPAIAATLRGFVMNNVLLRLTSYAAPLFLIVAMTGGWSIGHGPAPANVYALLAAGTLLLIFGPLLERYYPTEALDFAGILAMVFSAFNGLTSATLSASVLFAAAAILLVRYLRGAALWTFVSFLVLMLGGLLLQPVGTPAATAVFLLAAAAIAWASMHTANGAMARLGYWSAHGTAFVFWLSLARTLGLDAPSIRSSWRRGRGSPLPRGGCRAGRHRRRRCRLASCS